MSDRDTAVSHIRRIGVWGLAICAAGIVGLLIFARDGAAAFFQSYLFALVYWTNVTLGCLGLVILYQATKARWGLPILRFLEAGAWMLPIVALLFLPLFIWGMPQLYPWALPSYVKDPVLVHRHGYMNLSAFVIRWAVFFGIWWLIATLLRRWSLAQDATGDASFAQRRANLAGPAILIFVVTVTLAATDWVMSLFPHWFSTIWGFLFVVGQAMSAMSLCVLFLVGLASVTPYAAVINGRVLRDLGNMMLTLVVLWGYVQLSQFLLIWYGNLPEEITYYLDRMQYGVWWNMGTCLILFQFLFPFLLLLSNKTKLRPKLLAGVALMLLLARIVDIYWTVVPGFRQRGFAFHWTDVAAFLAIGGLWLAGFAWNATTRPLLPKYDPRLTEASEHA